MQNTHIHTIHTHTCMHTIHIQTCIQHTHTYIHIYNTHRYIHITHIRACIQHTRTNIQHTNAHTYNTRTYVHTTHIQHILTRVWGVCVGGGEVGRGYLFLLLLYFVFKDYESKSSFVSLQGLPCNLAVQS